MLDGFLLRMKKDFQTHILKEGVAAGFVLFDGKKTSCLLHHSDEATGIHYRLLPINRAIISELFSPKEMEFHLDLVRRHLKFPDGMRLMDRPPEYRGGKSVHFQRTETASHFGREIGLQYVHANIRYCEALAKAGRADELLDSLLIISPVAIADVVPNARPRQANLYFSSSDTDVYDRYEAAESMGELREGKVGALGGWRLYSSGAWHLHRVGHKPVVRHPPQLWPHCDRPGSTEIYEWCGALPRLEWQESAMDLPRYKANVRSNLRHCQRCAD